MLATPLLRQLNLAECVKIAYFITLTMYHYNDTISEYRQKGAR